MTGFERLQEQAKNQKNVHLKEVVNYLLAREDMEEKYLNEEKTLDGMCDFIKQKALKNAQDGWNFVSNELVFSWAIMYFTFPNSFLKIENKPTSKNKPKESEEKKNENKNNIVSLEDVKKKMEDKKEEVKHLSLFGGIA